MFIRSFKEYSEAYANVHVQRTDGVVELRLHTDGGPIVWGQSAQRDLVGLYTEVALDTDNEVVILTGTGDSFISAWDIGNINGVVSDPGGSYRRTIGAAGGLVEYMPKRLIQAQLDIEVPMIAAVNGTASIHSEQALLCDIVLAADTATFRDACHFSAGLVPGDGIAVAYSEAIGMSRARYFLLTGKEITARQAHDWGLVHEVMPRDRLLDRAWELARVLKEKPPFVRRMTRQLLIHEIKRRMHNEVGYGLALEHLAGTETWPTGLAPRDPRV
jgi:enoyl-CoA hydratase/carnithine racemase